MVASSSRAVSACRGGLHTRPAVREQAPPEPAKGAAAGAERDKRLSFGQHLRGLREAACLSRAGPARRAGVPASTLRDWEGDRGFPGPAAGLRLADTLGVSLERLAEGVEDTAEDEAVAAEEGARRRRPACARRGRRPHH
jgi:transcriptional regulator with XRE-family HTH domain